MITNTKLSSNFLKLLLSVVFAGTTFYLFSSSINLAKHYDGSNVESWEKYAASFGIGVIGWLIGELFTIKDDVNGSGSSSTDCF